MTREKPGGDSDRTIARSSSSVASVLLFTFFALQPALPVSDPPPSILAIAAHFGGRLGLAAVHLESGRAIYLNADEKFQTASIIKVPVMVEAFYQSREGKLDLEDRVTFSDTDRVPGAGILQDLSAGLSLKLIDAVTLMIVLSDNLASNLVIERVGIPKVNDRMASLGLKQTRLFKKVYVPAVEPVSEEAKKFGLGVTTPREMMLLMQKLAHGEVVDRDASDKMIEILKKQRDREQIPRYLGKLDLGGKVDVAHKTGALDAVRNDAGIVFTPRGRVALAVFCQESPDRQWTPDNEAALTAARAADAVIRALLFSQP